MNKLPSLNCAFDGIIPSNLIAYLKFSLIGSYPNTLTALCLSNTDQLNEYTELTLAYRVVELHKPIHVQVTKLSNEPMFVKHVTYVSEVDECDQLPYLISKSVPTTLENQTTNT